MVTVLFAACTNCDVTTAPFIHTDSTGWTEQDLLQSFPEQ